MEAPAWWPVVAIAARAIARDNRGRMIGGVLEWEDLAQVGALAYLTAAAAGASDAGAIAAARVAMRRMPIACDVRAIAERHHAAPAAHPIRGDGPGREAAVPRPIPWPVRSGARGRGLRGLPRCVRRAVGRLPAAQQHVLRLALQGRGTSEIARITVRSVTATASLKSRSLSALRGRLRPPA